MSLTFSNRETLLTLQWLESIPERRERFNALAARFAITNPDTAVPGLANAILAELETELPRLDGLAGEFLQSGLMRVQLYELALALVLDAGARAPVPTVAA
jgi:hypothetical protein